MAPPAPVDKAEDMNTHDPAVEVIDLVKDYGTVRAVQGISFRIERGESVAILGPNGAGKTTTIEILEGYRTRTAGHVAVLGEDPDHGGLAWRARLGIVLQLTGTFDEVTVRELVTQFAGYYPHPRDVDETISAVGLTAKADARISKLSGGQRRRVDVALGIIGNPEVLFLDEPTTGFDPQARREFWELIQSLRGDGTTILLTTHYLDEAAHLSDRAIVIARGTLLADSPIDTLGGPDARTPRVRWTDADGDHDVPSEEPGSIVAELHGSRSYRDLEVIRPKLEDIYLTMLADADADAAAQHAHADADAAAQHAHAAATARPSDTTEVTQ